MIFVTVGTYDVPFDRLLEAVDGLALGEELVVQHGPSSIRPRGATCFDYLPFDELVGYVRTARVVVAHAGVGSVLVALAHGHRPLVVPRLGDLGETSDDHQLAFARRFADAGFVTCVEDPERLGEAVARVADAAGLELEPGRQLCEELRLELAPVT